MSQSAFAEEVQQNIPRAKLIASSDVLAPTQVHFDRSKSTLLVRLEWRIKKLFRPLAQARKAVTLRRDEA